MARTTKSTIVAPTQERAVKSKAAILAAAQQVFAENGLHGARIDKIAQLSGTNKQRIYAYFGSKNELYRQTLLEVYAQAAQNRRLTALTEHDVPRLTGAVLHTFFDFHEEHPHFWRLLAWENLNGGQSLSLEDWQSIRTSYIDHIRELYATGQDTGLFREDVDFASYIMMLFSASYFYFSNQITITHLLDLPLASKATREKTVNQITQAITQGVLRSKLSADR